MAGVRAPRALPAAPLTWYNKVSNMLMLKTRPAANGRRNMKARLEPFSRSLCGKGVSRLAPTAKGRVCAGTRGACAHVWVVCGMRSCASAHTSREVSTGLSTQPRVPTSHRPHAAVTTLRSQRWVLNVFHECRPVETRVSRDRQTACGQGTGLREQSLGGHACQFPAAAGTRHQDSASDSLSRSPLPWWKGHHPRGSGGEPLPSPFPVSGSRARPRLRPSLHPHA